MRNKVIFASSPTPYICSRALIGRLLRPFGGIPFGEFAVLHDAARGFAVTQQNQVQVRTGLGESEIESFLQIGAAAQATCPDQAQRLLHLIGRRGDRHRCERSERGVEQEQVELVRGLEAVEQFVQRLEIAVELLPLHGERVVEQSHDRFRRGIVSGGCGRAHQQ